jgi:hypothetical protein
MVSYMEVVLKNGKGFTHFVMYNVYEPKHMRRRS